MDEPLRVTFDRVTATRGRRTVLSEITFTAEPGEVVGLLGVNGSGKSTLLDTVHRGLRPASGRVLVGEVDVADLQARQIARRVAVLSQSGGEEFDLTVRESVMLGRHPHLRGLRGETATDREVAWTAMVDADVAHLAARPWTALSGGERQRALFARALAQDTPVLALDEPTNHLDIAHRLDLLARVHDTGCTAVIALHDLDLAMTWCHSVAVLHRGRLLAHGPPREVMHADLVRQVFGVESEIVHPSRGDAPHLVLMRTVQEQSVIEKGMR